MTKVTSLMAALSVATLTAACGFEHSTTVIAPTAATTSPTTTPSAPSMMGVWSSNVLPAGVPDPGTRGNFQFQVSNQTSTSIVGSFTAACGDGRSSYGPCHRQPKRTPGTTTPRGGGTRSALPSVATFAPGGHSTPGR